MKVGLRLVALTVLLVLSSVVMAQTSVEQSVHNLSVNGPGKVKSTTESGVCIFCHAPHDAMPKAALWNKELPPDPSKLYTSSTYNQTNNPISQRSKLCLSCHDGTIALGQTLATGDLNVPTAMRQENILGAELSRNHPISFNLPAQDDGEIAKWLTESPLKSPDPAVRVFDDRMECTTCHDPHTPDNDPIDQKFLVRSNQDGALCTTCHSGTRGPLANFATSAHATATKFTPTTAATGMPYGTVAANACKNCHASHNSAGTGPRLLRGVEEADCLDCHRSQSIVTPAPADIESSLTGSTYGHPVLAVSGAHDAAEKLPVGGDRHAECADCHNPHQATKDAQTPVPPALPAALLGARGVSLADGSAIATATSEYEVCLQCHGDSTNKPQTNDTSDVGIGYGRLPQRASDFLGSTPLSTRANLRREFSDPAYISYHPVAKPRGLPVASGGVPSLWGMKAPDAGGAQIPGRTLDANSMLYCSDCHNNSSGRNTTTAAGAAGPHGSSYPHIVERADPLETPTPAFDKSMQVISSSGADAANRYALCNKCHDVAGVIWTNRDMSEHQRHVSQTPCATCHDPHASPNPALINFDRRLVTENSAGNLTFMRTATGGSCALYCHGHNHDGSTYTRF